MIHLYFVGDGPRDGAAIPRLVERILVADVDAEFSPWARLHARGRRGYGRKLRYAIRQARDRSLSGVVATVDSDKAPPRERLRELRQSRDDDRTTSAPLPTALGEAVPHLEAWLLDDPEALREALGLDSREDVPTVRKAKHPKTELNSLIEKSSYDRSLLDHLSEISRRCDPIRCRHASETGFKLFVDDVKTELGPSVVDEASQ
jgi:hypothetical protein